MHVSLEVLLRQAIEQTAARDAATAVAYHLDGDTPIRLGRDNTLTILCEPRLQISRQHVDLLSAASRNENLALPAFSTCSQHASRSRALRRLREQGLLSHSRRLRLTVAGEAIAQLLERRKFFSPVKPVQKVESVNRVAEAYTPLNTSAQVEM